LTRTTSTLWVDSIDILFSNPIWCGGVYERVVRPEIEVFRRGRAKKAQLARFGPAGLVVDSKVTTSAENERCESFVQRLLPVGTVGNLVDIEVAKKVPGSTAAEKTATESLDPIPSPLSDFLGPGLEFSGS